MNNINNYKKYGYTQLYNFLTTKEKTNIQNAVLTVFRKYIKISKNLNKIDDPIIHRKLINLRKINPKRFGQLYNEICLSASLRAIFYTDKFLKLSAKLLNIKKENLFINGFMLRLDVPNDKRNTLSWHQDAPYYEQTYPNYNSAVCWLPLIQNSKKTGSIKFIEKSHNKILKQVRLTKKNELSATQFKLKIDEKNLKIKNFNSDFGDLAFFDMLMVHKSGFNQSQKVRINFGCRIHDFSKKINIGQEVYIYNKTKKSQLIFK